MDGKIYKENPLGIGSGLLDLPKTPWECHTVVHDNLKKNDDDLDTDDCYYYSRL